VLKGHAEVLLLHCTFSCSWKKQRDLIVAQEQRGVPIHKLKVDVVIRWGSVYDKVEKILEQIDAVRSVLSEDRASAHLSPLWQDCYVLQSIVAALKGLKSVTDALAAKEYVTVSAVKSLLSYLSTEEVLVAEGNDNSLTNEIKRRIKDDLEAR